MADRETIQAEYEETEYVCDACGNKSRIKELEHLLETYIARDAALLRVKGKKLTVRETPLGESSKQV